MINVRIDNKYKDLFFNTNDDLIKKSEKFPEKIKSFLEMGKKLKEDWNNNNDNFNLKIHECIRIENSTKTIKKLDDDIKNYNIKKNEFEFRTKSENDLNDIITKISEFGEIGIKKKVINNFKFKFKNGKNYIVSEGGLVATKNSSRSEWNCTIIGDKEIPKNQISKWKIKLNNFKIESNTCNILIGIGPENPNNEINFYENCWTYSCGDSTKIIKSSETSNYNGHSKQLKKGDIVEVVVDRISGNISFAINDSDYGIASSQIPKDDTLYPIILIFDNNQKVEIV